MTAVYFKSAIFEPILNYEPEQLDSWPSYKHLDTAKYGGTDQPNLSRTLKGQVINCLKTISSLTNAEKDLS